MLKASHFRLDWRPEFDKLSRYLTGRGGVVRVEYDSEDAAPDIFNHIVKESFGIPNNGMWTSIRIDHDWYTTRGVEGILDEFDRLLSDMGFPVTQAPEQPQGINLVTNNEVGGNLTTTISGNAVYLNGRVAAAVLAQRTKAVCEAMRRYSQNGGHFMIVINDAPISDQSAFWQQIWNAGLSEAAGANLFLLIHAGPKAKRRQHTDCPAADEWIVLPGSVEIDETRQDDIYDDLYRIFKCEGVENPADVATAHLSNNQDSMLKMHTKLSAVLLDIRARRLKVRTA